MTRRAPSKEEVYVETCHLELQSQPALDPFELAGIARLRVRELDSILRLSGIALAHNLFPPRGDGQRRGSWLRRSIYHGLQEPRDCRILPAAEQKGPVLKRKEIVNCHEPAK